MRATAAGCSSFRPSCREAVAAAALRSSAESGRRCWGVGRCLPAVWRSARSCLEADVHQPDLDPPGTWRAPLPPLHCRSSPQRSTALHAHGRRAAGTHADKVVYLQPQSQAALIAGLEAGLCTMVFLDTPASRAQSQDWEVLGRFQSLYLSEEDGSLRGASGLQVGQYQRVLGPADVKALELKASAGQLQGDVLLDSREWKVIPAENLIALLRLELSSAASGSSPLNPPQPPRLLPVVNSAAEALLMLEALEVGSHGVVLRTEEAGEVRQLCSAVQRLHESSTTTVPLQAVRVTRVAQVASGDRVCVDLACLMTPGEGMLLGSLARGLFLVHSECEESNYINARPFRVNAGPVHAYILAPGERTAYLSELRSGSEVLVVDAAGRQRSALVGRVKVESRPLVLVEAEAENGQPLSILLQNAETVKLVGPATAGTDPGSTGDAGSTGSTGSTGDAGSTGRPWRTLSVAQLSAGDAVYALVKEGGARHTGIEVQEFLLEK